jgi:hypothetical protein
MPEGDQSRACLHGSKAQCVIGRTLYLRIFRAITIRVEGWIDFKPGRVAVAMIACFSSEPGMVCVREKFWDPNITWRGPGNEVASSSSAVRSGVKYV